ncbi:hypothetical protein [Planctomicrobium sp. SH527]|uniref:hypothetical protein n=1 Tax=Planctomicrobium sp. SH527 TaxID=3448123 RepID=UPI003F5C2FFF
MKKVPFSGKPTSRHGATSPDHWVNDRNGNASSEPVKRLTIDVPVSLHQRVKSQCALQGLKMADVIRELLEQRFEEPVKTGNNHDTELQ